MTTGKKLNQILLIFLIKLSLEVVVDGKIVYGFYVQNYKGEPFIIGFMNAINDTHSVYKFSVSILTQIDEDGNEIYANVFNINNL
jgi:branched-subunit amino acid permease